MRHQPYAREVPASRCAVLFVHGILGTPDHFARFLPLVPADWSVRSLLLAGHGGDVRAFSRASMAQWQAQVERAVDELCAAHERVYLVAHSMGTLLALQQAVRRPERIAGLFLLAVPLRVAPKPLALLRLFRLGLDLAPPSDASLAAVRAAYGLTPDRRVWRYLGWTPRYLELFAQIRRTRALLPRLTVPCQVWQSAHDELLPASAAEPLAALPCARVRTLPASGHYSYTPADERALLHAFSAFVRSRFSP